MVKRSRVGAAAARWFTRATAQGHANAALLRGKQQNHTGDGVSRNHSRAAQAWRNSALAGNRSAPRLPAKHGLTVALIPAPPPPGLRVNVANRAPRHVLGHGGSGRSGCGKPDRGAGDGWNTVLHCAGTTVRGASHGGVRPTPTGVGHALLGRSVLQRALQISLDRFHDGVRNAHRFHDLTPIANIGHESRVVAQQLALQERIAGDQ